MENQTGMPPASAHTAPALQPLAAWFARLGLSGKILGVAAIIGMIGTFLPGMTISMEVPGLKEISKSVPNMNLNTSKTTLVVEDWRGKIELTCFFGALALLYVLYPANGLLQKPLCWVGVGAGAFVTLLALWLLVAVLNVGSMNMGLMGSLKSSPGMGVFVTLLAGLALTGAGVLKAREEKLF